MNIESYKTIDKKKITNKISVRQIAKNGTVFYRLHLEQWVKVAKMSRLDARMMKIRYPDEFQKYIDSEEYLS